MAIILVVDDDQNLRELLTDILSNNGYKVQAAQDGRAALDALKKSRFDLVILDMHMPNVNGIDVLKVMRVSPATRKLPVLMCTSETLIREVEAAYQAGADGYVVKPYSAAKLLDKVAETLKKAAGG